jgi:hypothetical protein
VLDGLPMLFASLINRMIFNDMLRYIKQLLGRPCWQNVNTDETTWDHFVLAFFSLHLQGCVLFARPLSEFDGGTLLKATRREHKKNT